MTLAPVFYIMKVYNLSFLVLGGIYLNIQQVYAVYFSPTGHTKNLVCRLAADLAKALQVPLKTVSFDLPAEREGENRFSASDLVVVGGPTYAESFPIKSCRPTGSLIRSGDAGRRLVTYGNRSFDNALAELSAILEAKDFNLVAAGAFVANHAFSNILAAGRPDEADLADVEGLSRQVVQASREGLSYGTFGRRRRRRSALLHSPRGRRKAGQILEGRPQDGYGKMYVLRPLCPKVSHGFHRFRSAVGRDRHLHQVPALRHRLSLWG